MASDEKSASRDKQQGLSPALWAGFGLGLVMLIAAVLGASWAINQTMTGFAKTSAMILVIVVFTLTVWGMSFGIRSLRVARGLDNKMRAPMRRYLARFMPAMIIYTLILPLATTYWKTSRPEGWLLWVIAITPAIPVLFAIRAVVLYHQEEDDEFLKANFAAMQIWSLGVLLAAATVWGFLEMFGLVPHAPMWSVVPFWALCQIPGAMLARKRYG